MHSSPPSHQPQHYPNELQRPSQRQPSQPHEPLSLLMLLRLKLRRVGSFAASPRGVSSRSLAAPSDEPDFEEYEPDSSATAEFRSRAVAVSTSILGEDMPYTLTTAAPVVVVLFQTLSYDCRQARLHARRCCHYRHVWLTRTLLLAPRSSAQTSRGHTAQLRRYRLLPFVQPIPRDQKSCGTRLG